MIRHGFESHTEYKAQEVANLGLVGSKLPIDYGVMVHRKIKYKNSLRLTEIDIRIKVRILINQRILE